MLTDTSTKKNAPNKIYFITNVKLLHVSAVEEHPQGDLYKKGIKSKPVNLASIGPCSVIYSCNENNQMHQFLKLFIFSQHSTCFGRSLRPSSGVQDCTCSNRHTSNNCC
jgi:hypothetical protein